MSLVGETSHSLSLGEGIEDKGVLERKKIEIEEPHCGTREGVPSLLGRKILPWKERLERMR